MLTKHRGPRPLPHIGHPLTEPLNMRSPLLHDNWPYFGSTYIIPSMGGSHSKTLPVHESLLGSDRRFNLPKATRSCEYSNFEHSRRNLDLLSNEGFDFGGVSERRK